MNTRSLLPRLVLLAGLIGAVCCAPSYADDPKVDASTPIDRVQALAGDGDADAMLEYGTRLVQGTGVDTNTVEGLSWLQKAADAGNTEAWYALGYVYSNGVGVAMDLAAAIPYFRRGADAGNADCQTTMGLFYQAGERIPGGFQADPAEAVRWYRLAAEQNHTEAIQHLAMMHAMGMGIPPDTAEGLKWFRIGAELGNADCKWGLGLCYRDGRGVPQDSVMAYALFSASLDGVDNPGQKKAMTDKRDAYGKALTAEQLKKAEPIIEEWKAKKEK